MDSTAVVSVSIALGIIHRAIFVSTKMMLH